MTYEQEVESRSATLDTAVDEGLAYFEGPGRLSEARIGDWSMRELLSHLVYWHEVSVKGMESVASGGRPFRLELSVDEANARAVAEKQGDDLSSLASEARSLHRRFTEAALAVGDLDAVVVVRADGSEASVRQRFEITTDHWREHAAQLP